jgi:hypothetical protein
MSAPGILTDACDLLQCIQVTAYAGHECMLSDLNILSIHKKIFPILSCRMISTFDTMSLNVLVIIQILIKLLTSV